MPNKRKINPDASARKKYGGAANTLGVLGRMALLLLVLLVLPSESFAQGEDHKELRRGRIWDVVWGTGHIGDPGGWDFLHFRPKGMFPGFKNFMHPCCNEQNAINTFANANHHNFRSGFFILARDLNVPGLPPSYTPTPQDFEFFAAGAQGDPRATTSPSPQVRLRENYMEMPEFNPLLPEEMSETVIPTNTGITVTRRTYAWAYPGYRDFIIYDYVFKNTGDMVSLRDGRVVPNTEDFQQTLRNLYFAIHSAISVDTKSTINFHSSLSAVQAGAFGWQPPYSDFYYMSDDQTLFASYDFNGGKEPPPFMPWQRKEEQRWLQRFGPELQSPAAYGWVMLHADPTGSSPRTSARPDVLRIDTHKGGQFRGRDLDLEFFKTNEREPQEYYEFATTPDLQEQLGNNGDRFNMYTFTYGPYTLAPGDSVRIIAANVAGVMDFADIRAGDPDGKHPEASLEALRANAELARNAITWGLGATVDGIPLAADAPEPPPAPAVDAVNASVGTEKASIAVTWDRLAEETTITDGSGGAFYNGLDDLDGYRIFRSRDFQFTSDNEDPVLRGAQWDLLMDIPKAEFSDFFDQELGRYSFVDEDVEFGRRYGYYVSAYDSDPGTWTSANGTVVNDLPELASADVEVYAPGDNTRLNRTPPASALAGPVADLDIYVVPNPYVFNDEGRSFGIDDPFRIEFRNLPERATIRIYTLSGDLVRTLRHGPDERGNLFGTRAWDQKTDSGLLVAPGLYIYHVESRTEGVSGSLTGKLMIIR